MIGAVINDQNMLPPAMVSLSKTHKVEQCYRPLCLTEQHTLLDSGPIHGKIREEAPESKTVFSAEDVMAKLSSIRGVCKKKEALFHSLLL